MLNILVRFANGESSQRAKTTVNYLRQSLRRRSPCDLYALSRRIFVPWTMGVIFE